MKTTHDILTLPNESTIKESFLPDAEKIISGHPQQNIWNVYSSPDGKFHGGIWDCQAGEWQVNYSEEEYCQILEGESIIIDANGDQKTVTAGEQFIIPAGFRGVWKVPAYCKKTYVVYEAQL